MSVSHSFPLWILATEHLGVFRDGALGPVFCADLSQHLFRPQPQDAWNGISAHFLRARLGFQASVCADFKSLMTARSFLRLPSNTSSRHKASSGYFCSLIASFRATGVTFKWMHNASILFEGLWKRPFNNLLICDCLIPIKLDNDD